MKKNLWQYQRREGDLLSRENAVLEKEEKQKQVCFICLSFSCPRSLENSQIFLKKTNQVRNLSPRRRLNFRQNFVFSPFLDFSIALCPYMFHRAVRNKFPSRSIEGVFTYFINCQGEATMKSFHFQWSL